MKFELDVAKEHTVFTAYCLSMIQSLKEIESTWYIAWWHNCKHGFVPLPDPVVHRLIALVDLGGSLAVASKGLFATGVSTDLNGEN